MSDTADEFRFRGEQLLNKSKLQPLRSKMREFIAEHDTTSDLGERRRAASRGRDLSDIVIDSRDERL